MKMIITETQLNKINDLISENKVITEESNNRYERNVKVKVGVASGYYQKLKYDNMIVEDITTYYDEMRITYLIDQEHRSWGIKGISLYDIQGYDDIEVELHLIPEGDDNWKNMIVKEVKIPLDWGNSLETESVDGEGVITIGNELEIDVYIDENGNFKTEMQIDVYTL
jgi:hypothetical protein